MQYSHTIWPCLMDCTILVHDYAIEGMYIHSKTSLIHRYIAAEKTEVKHTSKEETIQT